MATSSAFAATRRRLTGVARGGAFAIARHSLRSGCCAAAGPISPPSMAMTTAEGSQHGRKHDDPVFHDRTSTVSLNPAKIIGAQRRARRISGMAWSRGQFCACSRGAVVGWLQHWSLKGTAISPPGDRRQSSRSRSRDCRATASYCASPTIASEGKPPSDCRRSRPIAGNLPGMPTGVSRPGCDPRPRSVQRPVDTENHGHRDRQQDHHLGCGRRLWARYLGFVANWCVIAAWMSLHGSPPPSVSSNGKSAV